MDKKKLRQNQELNELETVSKKIKGTSRMGLRNGFTRVTFIIKKEYLKKIKQLSESNKQTILKIINQALDVYLADKEFIKIPPKKKGR